MLFVVLAIVLGAVGLLAAFFVLVMIVTAVSNLSLCPLVIAAALGLPISFPWMMGIGAAMALAIFIFGPRISKKTEDIRDHLGNFRNANDVLMAVIDLHQS